MLILKAKYKLYRQTYGVVLFISLLPIGSFFGISIVQDLLGRLANLSGRPIIIIKSNIFNIPKRIDGTLRSLYPISSSRNYLLSDGDLSKISKIMGSSVYGFSLSSNDSRSCHMILKTSHRAVEILVGHVINKNTREIFSTQYLLSNNARHKVAASFPPFEYNRNTDCGATKIEITKFNNGYFSALSFEKINDHSEKLLTQIGYAVENVYNERRVFIKYLNNNSFFILCFAFFIILFLLITYFNLVTERVSFYKRFGFTIRRIIFCEIESLSTLILLPFAISLFFMSTRAVVIIFYLILIFITLVGSYITIERSFKNESY